MKQIVIFITLYATVAFGQRLNKHLQEYIEEGRIWGVVEENHDLEREESLGRDETEREHSTETTANKNACFTSDLLFGNPAWTITTTGSSQKIEAQGKWLRGIVPEDENKQKKNKNEKAITRSAIPYDPCQKYNPRKPNFKAPGRRISEEKCREYLWGIWVREEKLKRMDECVKKIDDNHLAINEKEQRDTTTNKEPFIVGGLTLYNSSEYPHMGALGWKTRNEREYVFKCGSTLISDKFVLTAAHCTRAPVDDYIIESRPKIVRLSNTNLSNIYDAFDIEIINIIPHPNYTYPKRYYDIALVELEFELLFSDIIQPACLWTKYDTAELGDVAKITGWGALRFGSRSTSTDLQVAEVDLIESKLCDELMFTSRSKNWQGLVEHQICAGKLNGGVDACQGDSGGPLQVLKYKSNRGALFNVIGVTSFGIACGQANLPGIYTRVSSFIDWIENIVWN